MLAKQLGEFEKAGVNVEVVDFKGGSESLKAVIGGSADVVSGYFDHCVNLAAKGQHLQAFVVYDRFPGFALVVSPKHTAEIKSIKDLANKKVGVSAPGSSTDFFLKYHAEQERRRSELGRRDRRRPRRLRGRGDGAGPDRRRRHARSGGDDAAGQEQGPRRSSATRARQKDTLAVFGGEYPGGALYTKADWIASHEKEVQGMTNAIVATLKWIHSHTPEEIADKMPAGIRRQGQGALCRGAQEHAADVFGNRPHGPEGRRRRCSRCSASPRPTVAKANIDLSKTYTNKFVDAAIKKMGMK